MTMTVMNMVLVVPMVVAINALLTFVLISWHLSSAALHHWSTIEMLMMVMVMWQLDLASTKTARYVLCTLALATCRRLDLKELV